MLSLRYFRNYLSVIKNNENLERSSTKCIKSVMSFFYLCREFEFALLISVTINKDLVSWVLLYFLQSACNC